MNPLHFTALATERDLRVAIVEAGRICYERGLMTANDGNISTRLGEDRILITPSGFCQGRLEVDDLLVMDLYGRLLKKHPKRNLELPSETPMHLEVYRRRPDVRAVIHAHPTFATALTVSDVPFPVDVLPEVLLTLGAVPTTPHVMSASHEDVDALRALIPDHDALLLRQHGSLTVGEDLDHALIHLERIEKVAEIFYRAHALGKVNRIPPEAMQRLEQARERYLKGE